MHRIARNLKRALCMGVLVSIFITILGCSSNQVNSKKLLSQETTILAEKSPAPTELQPVSMIEETILNTLDDYSICNLKLQDQEETITDNLGKPDFYSYDLHDGCAWIELRCFLQYEGITVTMAKQLRVSKDDNETEYMLSEIELSNSNYETPRGIKVGDTLEDITKAYGLKGIYSMREDASSQNIICSMIHDRVNHSNQYEASAHDFNYGHVDKIAYVLFQDENADITYRPALIFLFENDVVTHIILHNWMYEVV